MLTALPQEDVVHDGWITALAGVLVGLAGGWWLEIRRERAERDRQRTLDEVQSIIFELTRSRVRQLVRQPYIYELTEPWRIDLARLTVLASRIDDPELRPAIDSVRDALNRLIAAKPEELGKCEMRSSSRRGQPWS